MIRVSGPCVASAGSRCLRLKMRAFVVGRHMCRRTLQFQRTGAGKNRVQEIVPIVEIGLGRWDASLRSRRTRERRFALRGTSRRRAVNPWLVKSGSQWRNGLFAISHFLWPITISSFPSRNTGTDGSPIGTTKPRYWHGSWPSNSMETWR